MQRLAREVPIASHVMAYAIRILRATHPETEPVPDIVRAYVRYGASPRGAQAMVLGGKIHALLDGRFNVAYSDIQAVAASALRHRIILNFEGEAEGVSTDSVVRAITPRRGPIRPRSRLSVWTPVRPLAPMTTAPTRAVRRGVPAPLAPLELASRRPIPPGHEGRAAQRPTRPDRRVAYYRT